MSVQERIRLCEIIEKMESHEVYCDKLGLENKSKLHEKRIMEGKR